ncbi:LppP/LprE family lipoprotein [Corynebacterium hansenii]|uniref:LppP/LprE family lipoprotein n=1 Tax=Corynebacterium hansenii TaxID=394964 RepID=A0ABV7ZRE2_9CORY|nr:LppP/LprE family lipoprotein [Corynebacterium hansenii]WJZ00414.1 hypothetical protein CHAN_09035 [Corynebacterium hansenii]
MRYAKGLTSKAPKAGFAAACALALALAGCGDGGGSGNGGEEVVTETTTVTGTDGAEGKPNPTTETETTTTGGGGGSGGDCGVDRNARVISDSIKKVDPPASGDRWELESTNFDPCGELTYALFHQMPQGNAQFATKILMFHDGEYLGVDALNPQQGWIIGEGDGWFEVEYKDWKALEESGEPNAAAPKYTTKVKFTWSESEGKVVLDGELPNQDS